MEEKKYNMYEKLKTYFETTPKEQLDREWEEITAKYGNSQYSVDEWLEYNKDNIKKLRES